MHAQSISRSPPEVRAIVDEGDALRDTGRPARHHQPKEWKTPTTFSPKSAAPELALADRSSRCLLDDAVQDLDHELLQDRKPCAHAPGAMGARLSPLSLTGLRTRGKPSGAPHAILT